jgi:hypothetical protein
MTIKLLQVQKKLFDLIKAFASFLGINLEDSRSHFDVQLSHDKHDMLLDDEVKDFCESNQRKSADDSAQPSDVTFNRALS